MTSFLSLTIVRCAYNSTVRNLKLTIVRCAWQAYILRPLSIVPIRVPLHSKHHTLLNLLYTLPYERRTTAKLEGIFIRRDSTPKRRSTSATQSGNLATGTPSTGHITG